MGPKFTIAKFHQFWFSIDLCYYVNYERNFDKKRKITKDIWYGKKDIFLNSYRYVYNKKVLEVFKINFQKYSNNIVVMRNSMFPEIAVKNEKFIIFDDPDNDFKDQELFFYNSLIFYNDNLSFAWLKAHNKFILKDLVVTYGFTENDNLNSLILKDYDYSSLSSFKDLIFDKVDKLKIRENVLKEIIKYSYDGPTEDLSYAKEGNGFIKSHTIIENIDKNKNDYDNPKKLKQFYLKCNYKLELEDF